MAAPGLHGFGEAAHGWLGLPDAEGLEPVLPERVDGFGGRHALS